MCDKTLTLEQAVRNFLGEKSAENLAAIETRVKRQYNYDPWPAIDNITTSGDTELQMAFAEAITQTRPATEEEAELWYNIDGKIMPILGFLENKYGNDSQMANIARVVMTYAQTNPESIPAIAAIIKATRKTSGLYGEDNNDPESEAGIYAQILKPKIIAKPIELSHFPD